MMEWSAELDHIGLGDNINILDHFDISAKPPAGIYSLKVTNGNTRIMCEICSKLTDFTLCSSGFIINFEQENARWEVNHSGQQS